MDDVRIEGTGTIFDGKTGISKGQHGDKVTVYVDFDGTHRVLNDFPAENVVPINERDIDEDIDTGYNLAEGIDDRILALADALGLDPLYIKAEAEDTENSPLVRLYVFYDVEDVPAGNYDGETTADEVWDVYTDWEVAKDDAAQYYMESIYNNGVDYLEYVDNLANYVKDGYFDDFMRDDITDRVYEMDDEELADELESHGLISASDKVPNPNQSSEDEDDDGDEPEMVYTSGFLEDKRDDLIDAMCDDYEDSLDYMMELTGGSVVDTLKEFGGDDIDNMLDVDKLVEDYLDVGYELASYDNREVTIESPVTHRDYYAYRNE